MKNQLIIRGFIGTLKFSRSFYSSSSSFALKNVTKSNFESALNDLRRHVRDADFVAVDLEMTGVTSAPWRESFEFDRFDIRYLKVKDSADKFAVVQFGICPFRWDPHNQSFIAHPHNFYIFPRQEIGGDDASYEFLCQTTSIDFLAKYQFDFNTCIREGVSYLSRSQEEEALKQLDLRYKNELYNLSSCGSREVGEMQLTRMADILFSERLKSKIREWRDGLLQGGNGGSEFDVNSDDSNQKFRTIFFKMRPSLSLTGFTSRQLRLIQLVVKNHFKDLAFVRVRGETASLQQLIVFLDSTNDRELFMREVNDGFRKEEELKIKDAVGFRHVIDLLSSEKKLIVGHNCFLDIAHIYRKFLGPLPSTPKEYASSIQKYFPYIIDTKILLNTNNVFQQILKKGRTSLSKAFALLCPQIASGAKTSGFADKYNVKVVVQVDEKRSLNWNSGAKHEAGYDAFMTGCVFAQACSHLAIDFEHHPPSLDLAHCDKLQKYINLLYLSWINGAIIDMRTGACTAEALGSNSLKSRFPSIFSNIIVLWGFPPKLKANDIRGCLSSTFGSDSITSIYHLDETAVFVLFNKAELVSDFLKLKETLEKRNDPVSVLHPLSKVLQGGRTCAANYEMYREICSSSISKVLFADQAEAIGITGKSKFLEPISKVKTPEDATVIKENKVFPDSPDVSERDQAKTGLDPPSYGHYSADDLGSFCSVEAQMSK